MEYHQLWRKSLNSKVILLRKSMNFAGVARDYSFWSESMCRLLPTDIALIPYKLKLMLYPELVASGRRKVQSTVPQRLSNLNNARWRQFMERIYDVS